MKLSVPIYQLKRKAKLLARIDDIPLHQALDRIAREQGYTGWSLLAAQHEQPPSATSVLSRLTEGDLVLLGARPGHGKTMLGLRLLLDAVREDRTATFFTLEYTEQESRRRIHSLSGGTELGDKVEIVTSDEISADYIMRHMSDSPCGAVAVIDYLQILDQKRSKPALSEQVPVLRDFARSTGVVLAFISQVDRSFDPDMKALPDMKDIRLPNPIDLKLFTKACFLHDGEARFQEVA